MKTYYNENDPFAANWLRGLIAEGLISDGEVDDRPIQEVHPADLDGFARCHFFAGIGGWDFALALAGWPGDAPVWTGSCPCQPFSVAGKGKGFDDERHLWPVWMELIAECRPATVFGEQTSSTDGRVWLDAVRSDLELHGYAVGAADLCAAGIGAPHIRQRLWFVANSTGGRLLGAGRHDREHATPRRPERPDSVHERIAGEGRGDEARDLADSAGAGQRTLQRGPGEASLPPRVAQEPRRYGDARGRLANADPPGRERVSPSNGEERSLDKQPRNDADGRGSDDGVGNASGAGLQGRTGERRDNGKELATAERASSTVDRLGGPWAGADWLPCRDGKIRPVEGGTFPLAPRLPGDVGRIRGYGNSIVPQVAAEFIGAFIEATS